MKGKFQRSPITVPKIASYEGLSSLDRPNFDGNLSLSSHNLIEEPLLKLSPIKQEAETKRIFQYELSSQLKESESNFESYVRAIQIAESCESVKEDIDSNERNSELFLRDLMNKVSKLRKEKEELLLENKYLWSLFDQNL